MIPAFRRLLRCRSGATAVEFAIICLPLLLLSLGIVEFGRAFFVRSDLSYAADVAARKVLIGQISPDSSDSEVLAKMESAVREAFDGGDPDLLEVSVAKETVDGMEFRVLSLRYPFTFLVPGLSDSPIALGLTRSIPIG
ncbi:TadE/TadG family type IV pilus assembly protein [Chelativorans salis]|uniref:Pilus assembly protein n=1 Tax=Chelativorans salis TaxID=2978478 RepID=A0ABT2LMG8_9HYPH|nr:TadE/TadG family type IV pilus assembly protein [Chelativorans sp. EGI FJ00035]MCT7374359.1 pilus assembly protein [Chelativorans sp. EGI FJ00035]